MSNQNLEIIERKIRCIPDYPKKGIMFRDITQMIRDREAFSACINELSKSTNGKKIDYVAGIEARGFIFGAALAYKLGAGFIPIRKKGKLPHKVTSIKFKLEYGSGEMEIHNDALKKGDSVVIVDDLLATGGTAQAAAKLIKTIGGKVTCMLFVIELEGLNGRKKLAKYGVKSLVKY